MSTIINIDFVSRRKFIKTTSAAGVASLLANAPNVFGNHHSDKIRIGLIGAGARGVGAGITHCAEADSNIELVAIGDLFKDHLDSAKGRIKESMAKRKLPFEKIYKVSKDRMFHGFDAYEKVIACDLDLVILATPPVFRPIHYRAAVEAGLHVFIEKPVAVDPAGVKDVIVVSKLAEEKGLTVVAGTQRRHAPYLQALVERVREGDMGEILSGQSTRMGGGLLDWRSDENVRRSEWSDMEWQLRRWLFTTWASGDFIVEQHVHNLDIVNWIMGSTPTQVTGIGGRQVRTGEAYPNVWDHISLEYLYPNGARITHIGSQIELGSRRNDLVMAGTRGQLKASFVNAKIEGERPFEYKGDFPDPAVEEYRATLDSIRNGKALNEGVRIAESTMTAIMGRMAAYTGRSLQWSWAMNASKLDLTPKKWAFGDLPLDEAAKPGTTKLI